MTAMRSARTSHMILVRSVPHVVNVAWSRGVNRPATGDGVAEKHPRRSRSRLTEPQLLSNVVRG